MSNMHAQPPIASRARERATELLAWARDPRLFKARDPSEGHVNLPLFLREEPPVSGQVAMAAGIAVNLREAAHQATMHSLEVFRKAQVHPSVSSHPGSKPRLALHSRINGRGTLEVYWVAPLRPSEKPVHHYAGLGMVGVQGSDFEHVDATWRYSSGTPNCLLRLMRDEYLDRLRAAEHVFARYAQGAACAALTQSLETLALMLTLVCNVSLEDWPVYEGTQLHVLSARERALRKVQEERAAVSLVLERLKPRFSASLARLGLPDRDALLSAQAQAQASGVSMPKLLAARPGCGGTAAQVSTALSLTQQIEAAADEEAFLEEVRKALEQSEPA